MIIATVAFFCVGAYGFEDDAALHGVLGAALAVALVLKVAVVGGVLPLGGALPYLGTTVFALLALTCFTSPWFDS